MAILTSKNTTPATVPVAIYNLKQFLKTAGWTVQASGDGIATYGAASDVITTGAAGANGMGQQRAWFRIRMPGATREFCIQTGSPAATSIRVKYSVAGFTTGAPSATQAPTAADEVVIANLAGGTDALPTGAVLVAALNKVSYWADSAAPYGWGMVGWSAVSATTFGLQLEAMAAGTYNAADPDPYVFQSYPNSANFGLFAAFSSTAATQYGWLATPGTASGYLSLPCYTYGGTTYNIPVNAQAPVNPFNGKDDVLPTPFIRDATTAGVGLGGYKGTGYYTRLLITNRANLTMLTVSTTNDRIVFGGMSIPWGTDGVAPIP